MTLTLCRPLRNVDDVRLVLCDECGSEGRIITMRGNDPDSETDHGPCTRCDGTGRMLVEVVPVTEGDLP
jgi:DnaJ-class molecular chaperone